MEFLIKITGRKNRTMYKLLETVLEHGPISTPEIVERINMKLGMKLSVTTNQISNWLAKSGVFRNTGRASRHGMLGGGYTVMLWAVDFEGLHKKFGIDRPQGSEPDKCGRVSYRLQYLVDTDTKSLTSIHQLKRNGIWDETLQRLEGNETNNM
tara:strand:- start:403 stop:861 length:459 start_codon:yes stop_codon:yes gene_type:complete